MLQLTSGNVGLTENVEGEPRQFMVWVGTSMTNALVLHTFEVTNYNTGGRGEGER